MSIHVTVVDIPAQMLFRNLLTLSWKPETQSNSVFLSAAAPGIPADYALTAFHGLTGKFLAQNPDGGAVLAESNMTTLVDGSTVTWHLITGVVDGAAAAATSAAAAATATTTTTTTTPPPPVGVLDWLDANVIHQLPAPLNTRAGAAVGAVAALIAYRKMFGRRGLLG